MYIKFRRSPSSYRLAPGEVEFFGRFGTWHDWIALVVVVMTLVAITLGLRLWDRRIKASFDSAASRIETLEKRMDLLRADVDQLWQSSAAPVPSRPVSGNASWLVYKNETTCATRDWKRGTKLLVTYGSRQIVCMVRDYGPRADIFPERIIDMSYEQFAKLADPATGVIAVTVRVL